MMNPNSPAPAPAFGCNSSFDKADLVLIPVPWDATASYSRGTALGPELIRKASFQMDFFNPLFSCAYNHRIHFARPDPFIESLNKEAGAKAQAAQKRWTDDKKLSHKEKALCAQVNQASQDMLDWVYKKACNTAERGKIPALVGGEHSISEGLVRWIGERYKGEFGLLHIDAHADLREAYQGFRHSHASVMFNILRLPKGPKKLAQVGVRDFCEEERRLIEQDPRMACFFDHEIAPRVFNGEPWAKICQEIIGLLPEKIYISLDIDGLSWDCGPGTGTPVPGGLSFQQTLYLLSEIKRQNKKLVAFDLAETAPGGKAAGFSSEWNGNVSARLIYFMAGLALFT